MLTCMADSLPPSGSSSNRTSRSMNSSRPVSQSGIQGATNGSLLEEMKLKQQEKKQRLSNIQIKSLSVAKEVDVVQKEVEGASSLRIKRQSQMLKRVTQTPPNFEAPNIEDGSGSLMDELKRRQSQSQEDKRLSLEKLEASLKAKQTKEPEETSHEPDRESVIFKRVSDGSDVGYDIDAYFEAGKSEGKEEEDEFGVNSIRNKWKKRESDEASLASAKRFSSQPRKVSGASASFRSKSESINNELAGTSPRQSSETPTDSSKVAEPSSESKISIESRNRVSQGNITSRNSKLSDAKPRPNSAASPPISEPGNDSPVSPIAIKQSNDSIAPKNSQRTISREDMDRLSAISRERRASKIRHSATSLGSAAGSKRSTQDRDSMSSEDYVEALPVIALANFAGSDKGQLRIIRGQQLFVLEKDVGNGWSFGEDLEGNEGLFPQTFVRYLEIVEDE